MAKIAIGDPYFFLFVACAATSALVEIVFGLTGFFFSLHDRAKIGLGRFKQSDPGQSMAARSGKRSSARMMSNFLVNGRLE